MSRKTYKVKLEVLVQLDDETLLAARQIIQEQVNEMYHRMARAADIRVVLQRKFEVEELE